MGLSFNNTYTQLPERFYSRQMPSPVSAPGMIRVNQDLARRLGIDPVWLKSEEGTATIAGNLVPEGAEPIATVYAGHQFGAWNPQLGDGRAILLGEVIGTDGQRYDIQLKGAGQTPYSRMGDGRSPLGPVLREYLVSEAMHALGIPTSRALAAVTTGETVFREEALPGAVLARVAKSHIRIGTVQFFASRNDREALKLLVGHVLNRHYPDLLDAENRPLALLRRVMEIQAGLVAKWQMAGFIHGVMNTDNMLLSGETIDYGPCAFMDHYAAQTVFSSIDHGGRYAFRNQPAIAHWNIACLAQALLPIISDEEETATHLAGEALKEFQPLFLEAKMAGLRAKFGLKTRQEADEALAENFLALLEAQQMDFTLAFRRLAEMAGSEPEQNVGHLISFPPAFDSWLQGWRKRCEDEDFAGRQKAMLATNPAMIPRNHLIENAIGEATRAGNLEPFHTLADALQAPFDLEGIPADFLRPPRPEEVVQQTFCGT